MFKNTTILTFVSTLMANPIALHVFIFLRIPSTCSPFTFCNMNSPSSLYRSRSFLLFNFAKKHKIQVPTSLHTSAPSKLSIVTLKYLPSSLYRPKSFLLFNFAKKHKIQVPTSLHTSAPSKLSIVTLKHLSVCYNISYFLL